MKPQPPSDRAYLIHPPSCLPEEASHGLTSYALTFRLGNLTQQNLVLRICRTFPSPMPLSVARPFLLAPLMDVQTMEFLPIDAAYGPLDTLCPVLEASHPWLYCVAT